MKKKSQLSTSIKYVKISKVDIYMNVHLLILKSTNENDNILMSIFKNNILTLGVVNMLFFLFLLLTV